MLTFVEIGIEEKRRSTLALLLTNQTLCLMSIKRTHHLIGWSRNERPGVGLAAPSFAPQHRRSNKQSLSNRIHQPGIHRHHRHTKKGSHHELPYELKSGNLDSSSETFPHSSFYSRENKSAKRFMLRHRRCRYPERKSGNMAKSSSPN